MIRAGELAAAAGVNPQTVRYYERRGLLAKPERSPGGHRLYPPGTVTRLRIIKAAQRLGFTLAEVADLVGTGPRHRGHPPAEVRADSGLPDRAARKLAEVETRIADLQLVAGTLREVIAAGCDDLSACATTDCCPLPFAGQLL